MSRKEINEIRGMINRINSSNINGNYPRTLTDEELSENVSYLYAKDTGLPCDVIVDCGENYQYFKHDLCLFVVQGQNVVPVTISESPKCIGNLDNFILGKISDFIKQHLKTLIDYANLDIDSGDFYDAIKDGSAAKMVVEMGTYGPDKTGLPMWIYVDDTNAYLRSGHNQSYRIKFKQDKDIKNPRYWMPVTIPGLQIMDKEKIPPCKEPKRNVNMVIEWAKGNMDLLLSLRDGKINGAEFRVQMKSVNDIKILMDSEINNGN